MYIARNKIEGLNRFYIRESFLSEGIYQARDLMDLGEDPRRFIKYIDQRAFYIDECVEDRLRENGAEFSQDSAPADGTSAGWED